MTFSVADKTVLSLLTVDFKKVLHRRWDYFKTRVSFTIVLFNLLVQWEGLPINQNRFVPLSTAQFSL